MTEAYFSKFRNNIVGIDQEFPTPFGNKKIIYADWIASGRMYDPIEIIMREKILPFCGNTHTETSVTGTLMTKAYHEAKEYIKREVNANEQDALIFAGSGMTAAINKLQRIMGLRMPENCNTYYNISENNKADNNADKPIVFVTHLEHHSNHTSWLETIADVEIIEPTAEGLVDLNCFADLLKKHENRKLKIASISACSNVTGIITPYYEIAEMIHAFGGLCFVDFACSGPYVDMNMHPANEAQQLDVIFISPHKFLGGPGTPGVMIINKKLYTNTVPDNAGGGTVKFTTPWKYHEFIDDIEEREDGGTPPFLQGIKAALSFKLKKEMGVENIMHREKEILHKVFYKLQPIANLHILADNITDRIGAISFYIDDLHFNLGVKILNDYFGIQVRGGCACAGTYGHYLLNISEPESTRMINKIKAGDLFARLGWIRLSIHPTLSDAEIDIIINAITYLANEHLVIAKEYTYNPLKNIFTKNNYNSAFEQNLLESVYSQVF
jgi:selenocysteine lyase/cysteine desulfurase